METVRKTYIVDRPKISYIRWVIESYDGMAIVTTINPVDAVIEVKIAPGCENLVNELILSLRENEGIKFDLVEQR
ncbi:MAG: DUF4911 domain-containing protein [Deltaproteobacteria bacterium]|nr:DUF4911 domain-containing protein [Deltaproteobacteria bacterium]